MQASQDHPSATFQPGVIIPPPTPPPAAKPASPPPSPKGKELTEEEMENRRRRNKALKLKKKNKKNAKKGIPPPVAAGAPQQAPTAPAVGTSTGLVAASNPPPELEVLQAQIGELMKAVQLLVHERQNPPPAPVPAPQAPAPAAPTPAPAPGGSPPNGAPVPAVPATASDSGNESTNPIPREFLKNADEYVLTASSKAILERYEAVHLKAVVGTSKKATTNPHELSAAARRYTTVMALKALYRQGCRNIISLCGADRDVTLVRRFNLGVPKDDQMRITLHRPTWVPMDLARTTVYDAVDDFDASHYDGFLLGDIYKWEDQDKVTAHTLARWAKHGPVVWHGLTFYGEAGVMFDEGAWIRDDTGLIHSKSDAGAAPYPTHHDLNWLACAGQDEDARVSWARVFQVGPRVVSILRAGLTPYHDNQAPLDAESHAVKYLPIPATTPALREWFNESEMGRFLWRRSLVRSVIGTKRVRVHAQLYTMLRAWLSARKRTGFIFQSVHVEMRRAVEKDPAASLLTKMFPESYGAKMLRHTCLAAWFADLEEDAHTLRSVHVHGGSLSQLITDSIKEIGDEPKQGTPTNWKLWGFGALVGAGALYLAYRNGVRPPVNPARWLGSGLSWLGDLSGVRDRLSLRVMEIPGGSTPQLDQCLTPDVLTLTHNGIAKAAIMSQPMCRSLACSAMLAPFWEEPLKRIKIKGYRVGLWGLIAYETLTKGFGMPFLARNAMHLTTAVLPLEWGIGLHFLYNTAALATTGILSVALSTDPAEAAVCAVEDYSLQHYATVLKGWVELGKHYAEMGYSPEEVVKLIHAQSFNEVTFNVQSLGSSVSGHSASVALTAILSTAVFTPKIRTRWVAEEVETEKRMGRMDLLRLTARRDMGLVMDYLDDVHEQPWSQRRRPRASSTISLTFPLYMARVPKQITANYEKKPLCELLKVKVDGRSLIQHGEEVPPVFEIHDARAHMYLILPTQVPMYAPDNSDANLWAVIRARVIIEAPLDPEAQARGWAEVVPFVLRDDEIVREAVEKAWWDHIEAGPKLIRLRRASDELNGNFPAPSAHCFNQVVLMVKTDEVLMKVNPKTGELECKPRCIANVDPTVQVLVGPEVYEATQRLAAQWTVAIFELKSYGPVDLAISYGSKATDFELSRWMESVHLFVSPRRGRPAAAILVAGDDMVIAYNRGNGELVFYEGDATSFDQSQSYGCLEFEYRCLAALGVGPRVIQVLRTVSRAKYVAHFRSRAKVTIDRHDRPMRDTGGADTTVGNGIVMAHACAHFVVNGCSEDAFLRLGLAMKLKKFSDPADITFLKGSWSPSKTGRWYWAPLPSRFLKVGKALSDPRALYRGAPEAKGLYGAARLYLADVAASYRPFVLPPVLRAFVEHYYRGPSTRNMLSPWQVQAAARTGVDWREDKVQENLDFSALYRRYGWDEEDVARMEKMIYESEPGTMLVHPGFDTLADADYM